MPWYNGDYPSSYKNPPKYLRKKTVEIANEVLKTTHNEGEAIATGLNRRATILNTTLTKYLKIKTMSNLKRFLDARLCDGFNRDQGRPQAQPLDVVYLPADRWPGLQRYRQAYAIKDLAEAKHYLAHPVLG